MGFSFTLFLANIKYNSQFWFMKKVEYESKIIGILKKAANSLSHELAKAERSNCICGLRLLAV